jgi:cystathionine beta-lyase/cystathionine gamma-synthase
MGHIREYSTKEVATFLEETNFKIEKIKYLNHYSFFEYASIKNPLIKLGGLFVDVIMMLIPNWRRHQAFIANKK